MKVSHIALMSMLLAMLQACSTTNQSQAPQKGINSAELQRPESVIPQSYVLRGMAVIGHESRTLQPCGSHQQFWLDLPLDIQQQAQSMITSPYQPIYAEVIGYLEPPSHRGFDSDYSGRFVVKTVNLLTTENPKRCEQPVRATQVLGNEPFWSIRFEQNNLAIFQELGQEKQSLELVNKQLHSQSRYYQFKQAELTLAEQRCNDTMSDTMYGWSATYLSDGNKRQGCAMLSNLDATLIWSGEYLAQSTEKSGFAVKMTLLPDHSAVTTYEYSDNSPATIERGFWQQLNDKQVQVIMTRHQQQYLVSQRIFTLKDNSLIATQEKVGDVLYPIANGGLVLFRAK
jgi:putative lipoprotein